MDQGTNDRIAADGLPVCQENNGLPVGGNLNRTIGEPAGDEFCELLTLDGLSLKTVAHAVGLRGDPVFSGEKDLDPLPGEKVSKRAENHSKRRIFLVRREKVFWEKISRKIAKIRSREGDRKMIPGF